MEVKKSIEERLKQVEKELEKTKEELQKVKSKSDSKDKRSGFQKYLDAWDSH